MAEEPQPPTVQEGAQPPSSLPAANKSEASALNNLDSSSGPTTSTSTSDAKALGHAMKNLSVDENKKTEVKNVKVELGDVALLAEHLDISKPKATDLLKANDADPVKAIRAWIAA